jgi:2-polyprenyl-3-methyl-5-hydroxy-6-metoxy-1,4-benzoquinol methylase
MSQQENWNSRFAQPGFAYGESENDFLKESIQLLPNGKILSLGEGEGRNAVYLAKQGYDVTAVDYAEVGLEKAQKLAKQNGVTIKTIQADLTEFKFDQNSWQGIISIYFHIHKDDRRRIHKKCVSALAPNGVFLMESYSLDQLKFGTGGPKNSDLLIDLDEVILELEGLDLEIARVTERDIFEGNFHTGRGSVVQIVGIKK